MQCAYRTLAGLRRTEEEQRFDGYYNNVDNKDWGSVGECVGDVY